LEYECGNRHHISIKLTLLQQSGLDRSCRAKTAIQPKTIHLQDIVAFVRNWYSRFGYGPQNPWSDGPSPALIFSSHYIISSIHISLISIHKSHILIEKYTNTIKAIQVAGNEMPRFYEEKSEVFSENIGVCKIFQYI
jgi:hypothetical protein